MGEGHMDNDLDVHLAAYQGANFHDFDNDPVVIVERFKNLLAPGGKMFLVAPNAEVLNRGLGHLAGLLGDMQALSDNDRLLGHKRYYIVDTLSADIARAGCQNDRIEGIYLKPFATSQIVSLDLVQKLTRAVCEIGIGYPEPSCGMLTQISVRSADIDSPE
jgi:hypothetical protein